MSSSLLPKALTTRVTEFCCQVCGQAISTEHYVPVNFQDERIEDACVCDCCGAQYHIAAMLRYGKLLIRPYLVSAIDPVNYPGHNPVILRRAKAVIFDEA